MPSSTAPARKAIEAVWRIESARVLGGLVRFVHDLDLAEDAAQEALLAALERWPVTGIPERPGAWLMTTARNRAIDAIRRRRMQEEKEELLAGEAPLHLPGSEAIEAAADDEVGDDLLRLVFIACHPVLSKEARVALTLRMVAGLSTGEIARAFLVAESAIAQRIVRAKRTLSESRVQFEVPRDDEFTERIPSVLEVIYLIFNEGYTATRGNDWMRPELCEEAQRLGRILAGLVPDEAEVHGLVALLEIQASRTRARTNARGEPILLLDQDRGRWDQLLVRRGLAALERAESLRKPLGPYALQAAIAACHARARTAADTDWERIVALYDALVELSGSPVVALNRAVAVAMAFGPAEGLAQIEKLVNHPALAGYHLLPSVRGDLLAKLGRTDEAREAFTRAARMTGNAREMELLLARADEMRTRDVDEDGVRP